MWIYFYNKKNFFKNKIKYWSRVVKLTFLAILHSKKMFLKQFFKEYSIIWYIKSLYIYIYIYIYM